MKTVMFEDLTKELQAEVAPKLEQTKKDGSVWVSPDGKDVVLSPFVLTGPTGYRRVDLYRV